jgi:hypothetical protein
MTVTARLWFVRIPSLAAVVCLLGASVVPAAETLSQAFSDGTPELNIRYRYENVDQDGFDMDARASTIRFRFGYTTAPFYGVFVGVDAEYVATIIADNYNDFENGKTEYPVVADPIGAEANQAFIGYEGLKNTVFKLGRQRFILDNQRFFGNVGWRQNEQTFDALTTSHQFGKRVLLKTAAINNVNTIWGESHNTRDDIDVDIKLAHVAVKIPGGTLTAYGHFIEFEDSPMASHRNVGLRYHGKHAFNDDVDLLYTGEYADQADYKDGSSSIDAEYYVAELGARWKWFTVKAGYEVLGSNDGLYGFATPLATLHKFNGWTDLFLVTPANGLEDAYVSVGADLWGFKALAVYHDFSPDESGDDFGSEIDLQVARKFKKHYTAVLKYANFDSDSTAKPDTTKLWGILQLAF